ncbi:MAG: hypothetical protein Q9220_007604 [cf. Caloplaca sp. 1 TL-2023]
MTRRKITVDGPSDNRRAQTGSTLDQPSIPIDALLPFDDEAAGNQQAATPVPFPTQAPNEVTANLIGVDVQRISELASFFWFLPASAIRLAVSIVFLQILIGWQSLVAGLLGWSITIPINIVVSRRYGNLQHDLMKARDAKLASITETLKNIRQIKFAALESQAQENITAERTEELSIQWKLYLYQIYLFGLLIAGPVLLSAAALITYISLHGNIVPSIAFTTIAVLSQMEFTLAIVPGMVTQVMNGWVSLCRIEEYLSSPEQKQPSIDYEQIVFEHASLAWPSSIQDKAVDDGFVLHDIHVAFPSKQLSIISGPTGSGKSLLLAGILGESTMTSGLLKCPRKGGPNTFFENSTSSKDWIIDSAMAFVAQNPWIDDGTIQTNIIFGLPHDRSRYEKTLLACALEEDLRVLPSGDQTATGANGINLSGGQRWRVAFARALYSRAGILVLDDILSSVDARVAQQLFNAALTGELGSGRTRILVTHHTSLCEPSAQYLVRLRDGRVEYAGTKDDTHQQREVNVTVDFTDVIEHSRDQIQHSDKDGVGMNGRMDSDDNNNAQSNELLGKHDSRGDVFFSGEDRAKGRLKWELFQGYLSSSGGLTPWILAVSGFLTAMGLELLRTWWISQWTQPASPTNRILHQQTYQYFHSEEMVHQNTSAATGLNLGIYIILSLLTIALGMIKYIWIFIACIRASEAMFDKVLSQILTARMRWLDTVPVGRILNRFTTDFSVADSRIANNIAELLYTSVELVGITITGAIVSPIIIAIALISVWLAAMIGKRYLAGAREVKRLEAITRSPILETMERVQSGIATIRAFEMQEHYTDLMHRHIDRNTTALMHIWLFNQWMSFRLNMLATAVAVLLSTAIVLSKSSNVSLAGFALAFALRYNDAIIWVIRYYAIIEMDLNSVERISEYASIPTEDQEGTVPPAAWPSEGRIEISDLVATYDNDLPPVLKGVSFVAEKQLVAIIGRTGAGKSSLILAILRLLEIQQGTIFIDGVNIADIRIQTLRSRLAIIPQDPVLLSGTLRSNLDPENKHSDQDIHHALEKVNLVATRDDSSSSSSSSKIDRGSNTDPTSSYTESPRKSSISSPNTSGFFNNLSSPISSGGQNLSQGQRQLLRLAGAFLTHPKILILDEPTSAVDSATDKIIHALIEEGFRDSTVLVIAHRLSTIVGFEKIMVMRDGTIVESGTAKELLEANGEFTRMVERTRETAQLKEMVASP